MRLTLYTLLFIYFGFNGLGTAQDKKTSNTKNANTKDNQGVALLFQNAKDKNWAMEASRLYGKKQVSYALKKETHFLAIVNNKGIIRLSFQGLSGWDGIGGITLEGKISKYDCTKGKGNQPFMIKYRISGSPFGNVDVKMEVEESGLSNVVISGNWGSKVLLEGYFYEVNLSKAYKKSNLK